MQWRRALSRIRFPRAIEAAELSELELLEVLDKKPDVIVIDGSLRNPDVNRWLQWAIHAGCAIELYKMPEPGADFIKWLDGVLAPWMTNPMKQEQARQT